MTCMRVIAALAPLLVCLLWGCSAAADGMSTARVDVTLDGFSRGRIDVTKALLQSTGSKEIKGATADLSQNDLQLTSKGATIVVGRRPGGTDSFWTSWPSIPDVKISKAQLRELIPNATDDITIYFHAAVGAGDGTMCNVVQPRGREQCQPATGDLRPSH